MALNSADYEFVSSFSRRTAAIIIEPGKDYFIESRLAPLAASNACKTISEFISLIRKATPSDPLHLRVIDALTTNETFFFRDIVPFEALEQKIIPEILEKRCNQRTLTLWSAACSTGQEPYSLAILLKEKFPQLADWNVKIIASDLSPTVLTQAKSGRYSEFEVKRGLSPELIAKYFTREGDAWFVKDELKKWIDFRRMNLIEPWPPLPVFDAVLLRNVMIYFDVETKKNILGNIRRCMQPGGALFLGSAETTMNLDPSWEAVGYGRATAYRAIAS